MGATICSAVKKKSANIKDVKRKRVFIVAKERKREKKISITRQKAIFIDAANFDLS